MAPDKTVEIRVLRLARVQADAAPLFQPAGYLPTSNRRTPLGLDEAAGFGSAPRTEDVGQVHVIFRHPGPI